MLDNTSIETIVLRYHDLYKRYRLHRRMAAELESFLEELVQYFEDPMGQSAAIIYLNSEHLTGAKSPMDAVRRYLADAKKVKNEKDEKEE
jgi:hypothetical protein